MTPRSTPTVPRATRIAAVLLWTALAWVPTSPAAAENGEAGGRLVKSEAWELADIVE